MDRSSSLIRSSCFAIASLNETSAWHRELVTNQSLMPTWQDCVKLSCDVPRHREGATSRLSSLTMMTRRFGATKGGKIELRSSERHYQETHSRPYDKQEREAKRSWR
jgi:hypothetical protein